MPHEGTKEGIAKANEAATVDGYTDNVGKERSNQALSGRRAAAVKTCRFENGGVNADKITPVGYGSTRPIADNKTAEEKFRNRRVEILILPEQRFKTLPAGRGDPFPAGALPSIRGWPT